MAQFEFEGEAWETTEDHSARRVPEDCVDCGSTFCGDPPDDEYYDGKPRCDDCLWNWMESRGECSCGYFCERCVGPTR